MGANHWVNDTVWAFFPENGNALEWDRDFAEMAARGLNFVRTGIWFDRLRIMDSATGAARSGTSATRFCRVNGWVLFRFVQRPGGIMLKTGEAADHD